MFGSNFPVDSARHIRRNLVRASGGSRRVIPPRTSGSGSTTPPAASTAPLQRRAPLPWLGFDIAAIRAAQGRKHASTISGSENNSESVFDFLRNYQIDVRLS